MPKRSSYKLAAFDPGQRTGYALVEVRRFTAGPDLSILDQGVLTVREVGSKLAGLLKPVQRVVYETWRLYPDYAQAMIGNDMQPSQVVGMIRYEAWKQRKRIIGQGASIKTPAFQSMPDWLKDHMAKSSEQHDPDALMHAWYYAIKDYYREEHP